MTNITVPGFQKQVNLTLINGYPGDLASDRTIVTLGADGKFALGDVIVGNLAFATPSGNQVCSNSTTAGLTTPLVAGFILRNSGLAPMNVVDSNVGFGMVVPDGKQATVFVNGDAKAVITGVNSSGAADHVPTVGEIIWANNNDGSLASTPASVVSVTGYTLAPGFRISKLGQATTATVGTNQIFAVFSGYLGGS